jgi:hypothetical protein
MHRSPEGGNEPAAAIELQHAAGFPDAADIGGGVDDVHVAGRVERDVDGRAERCVGRAAIAPADLCANLSRAAIEHLNARVARIGDVQRIARADRDPARRSQLADFATRAGDAAQRLGGIGARVDADHVMALGISDVDRAV